MAKTPSSPTSIDTVYSLQSKKPLKGLVEIFHTHDEGYYAVALDGQMLLDIHKNDSVASSVMSRSFMKECKKISGIDEDKLHFVFIDWFDFAQVLDENYDANDFDEYPAYLDFVASNGSPNTKHVKYLGQGIEKVEDKLSYYG